MYCQNCGKELKGDEKYCARCGSAVHMKGQDNNRVMNSLSYRDNPADGKNPEKRKHIIVILIVVIIIGGIVFAGTRIMKNMNFERMSENISKDELYEENSANKEDSQHYTERTEEEIAKKLSDYSSVRLLLDWKESVSKNQIIWGAANDEQILVQTDLSGKIYNTYPRADTADAEAALTDDRILFKSDRDYYIYDFGLDRDVTAEYTGGDKKICYANKECIMLYKIEETYNSENIYMDILDREGNGILSFSTKEMGEKYNVNWERNEGYGECGSHIYYIEFESDQDQSVCFLDMERRKAYVSSNLPGSNSGSIRSDGEYIIDSQPYHGNVVINCETEEVTDLSRRGTVEGISEGKVVHIVNNRPVAYLNTDGTTAIELNYENTSVTDATQFENGYAMIEFNNYFTTIIDTEGNFLFEPIKGSISYLLDINGKNAYIIHMNENYYLLDETGELLESFPSSVGLYPLEEDKENSLVIYNNNSFSIVSIY